MQTRQANLDVVDGLFIRLGHRLRGRLNEEELTLSQLVLLRELHLKGRLAMSRAADALGMSPAAATAAVDRLVCKGWVSRCGDLHDRRLVWVEATESAQNRLTKWQSERRKQLDALLTTLEDNELESLVTLLSKVVQTDDGGRDPGIPTGGS